MTDRLIFFDHGTDTAGTAHVAAGTESDTATGRYSVPQVARRLGISERAVRKQIETGKLLATKDGTAWVVFMDEPGTANVPTSTAPLPEPHNVPGTAGTAPLDTTPVAHDNIAEPGGTEAVPESEPAVPEAVLEFPDAVPAAVPVVDLQPLVALVERLTQENRSLAESATIWQFRAHQLEEQIKQLTTGPVEMPQDAPQATETHTGSVPHTEPVSAPVASQRSFWRRLWGG